MSCEVISRGVSLVIYVFGVIATVVASAGCSPAVCTRHSDCAPGLECSTRGLCSRPDLDGGGGDGGDGGDGDAGDADAAEPDAAEPDAAEPHAGRHRFPDPPAIQVPDTDAAGPDAAPPSDAVPIPDAAPPSDAGPIPDAENADALSLCCDLDEFVF